LLVAKIEETGDGQMVVRQNNKGVHTTHPLLNLLLLQDRAPQWSQREGS